MKDQPDLLPPKPPLALISVVLLGLLVTWNIASDAQQVRPSPGVPRTVTFAGGQTLAGATANVTTLSNGTAAQTFDIFETNISASSYGKLRMAFSGGTARIGTANAGAGATAELWLGTAGLDAIKFYGANFATLQLVVSGGGNITPERGDGAQTFGSAAKRWDRVYAANGVSPGALAFASLPATPTTGMISYITDSTTAVYGATIAGGGANGVLGVYNGANWIVH